MKNLRTICGLVILTLSAWSMTTQSAFPQNKILFHGADADATAGADGDVQLHLENTGYEVTYMQGDMAAADGSSADGFDLVMISSTLNSGTVRNKYEDTTIGLMNWEQALMRQAAGEFNMSVGGATGDDQTEIIITDPSSPLAAGLSGTVTVFDSPATTQFGTGALGAGVNGVATAANGSDHAIFSADIGDVLLGDGSAENPDIAAGRRVMFFIQDSSFNNLTPEGIQLFDAAVAWAIVPEPSSAVLGVIGLLGLMLARRSTRSRSCR